MDNIVKIKQFDKDTIELEVNSSEIVNNNCVTIRNQIQSAMSDYENIVFDLSKVEYTDSSGIGILLSFTKVRKVTLKNCNDYLKNVLEVLNMRDRFAFV
jgi:anti-anti-sigma factor